mgnify:CR=1 FL=1
MRFATGAMSEASFQTSVTPAKERPIFRIEVLQAAAAPALAARVLSFFCA